MTIRRSAQRTPLTPTRPTTPEPTITAAALPDPIGPLAAPRHLRIEHHLSGDVLGGAWPAPRLSWEVPTAPALWTPTRAELEITRTALNGTPLPGTGTTGHPGTNTGATTRPDTGTTVRPNPEVVPLEVADGVLAPWPAAPLGSRERVVLRVRVAGAPSAQGPAGAPWSPWSAPLVYETGLLSPQDWRALPVGPAWPENPTSRRRPPRVRGEITVDRPVAAARVYLSAHGLIRAELDGVRIGADELVPGWTVYDERLAARAYDVTAALLAASARGDGVGPHAVGAQLADGWYRGHIGFDGGYHNLYGEDVAAIVQLELTHTDGSRTIHATDATWSAGAGEIFFTGLYEGETVDARLADPAWSRPGYEATPDRGWSPVRVGDPQGRRLVMATDAPVRAIETLEPVSVTRHGAEHLTLGDVDLPAAPERYILDFGQNISGRLRLSVAGPAGTVIRLRHAEVLEGNSPGGELGTRPLREAAATDTYTLRGRGLDGGVREEWEPAFTIHGFRYAEVVGWPGGADPEAVTRDIASSVRAVVVHTDMERLGAFTCSHELVTRLHENSRWSMRGNFVAIPTDCPQRDERLGWTGDIQAFTPTAAFHYRCSGLLASWLTDLAIEQRRHGTVPWYVPVIPGGFWTPPRPAAVWGDAATLVPWELYRATGDTGLLEQQYESAKQWVDLVDRLAGPSHIWDTGLQLGDWLDPAAPPDDPMRALTDRYLVATAFFAHSARVMSQWATVLGRGRDAAHYGELADDVAAAFRGRYGADGGRLSSHSQTAYALAIAFDLCGGEQERARAGEHLAALVADADDHVATGFAGTPVVTAALSDTGQIEAAYRLLEQTTCPSWLYAVTMGATTTWERWDSLLPDGSINPGGMTSFNHYALGAVAAWLQRTVGGLAPAEPGYRVMEVAPQPGGSLTSGESVHRTPYGWAASSWRLEAGSSFRLEVVVPVGARARVRLPGVNGEVIELGHGRHRLSAPL